MKLSYRLIVPCVIASVTLPARGAGFRLWHQDPSSLMRGHAFVATADNASGIYYNPAGITQLEGHQFRAGAYSVLYNVDYDGATGDADTVDHLRGLAQFYYTYSPDKSPFSFGLGTYMPFGLGSEWRDDSPLRTFATESELIFVTINPVVAWEINEHLSAAAGPNLNYGSVSLKRGILVEGDEYAFKGDGFSPGFNAGLLWKPHDKHSFGVNYRSETTLDFKGHSGVRSLVPFIPSGSQSASSEIPFPQNITLGYSFRPTPKWNFEADIDWTDWDQLNTVVINQDSGDLEQTFDWKSSFSYLFGVTRYLNHEYSLSAGYLFSENSIPDANYAPAVPDFDFHAFSIGATRAGKSWTWSVAYQFIFGNRDVQGSAPSPVGASADGRYEFQSHAVSFAVNRSF